MAAKKPVSIIKSFTNVDEVIEKLDELGFFYGPALKEERVTKLKNPTPGPFDSIEHWFSNGYLELKIFRRMFGGYELCNFRGIKHKEMEAIFAVADRPKVA